MSLTSPLIDQDFATGGMCYVMRRRQLQHRTITRITPSVTQITDIKRSFVWDK
jgi:hypothetical protein